MSLIILTFCIALSTYHISKTSANLISLEAEHGSYTGSQKPRSEASGQATILLLQSQSVTNKFTTASSCLVSIHDVAYTNNGDSDVVEAYIDGFLIGSFQTTPATSFGQYWKVVRNTGNVGRSRFVKAGSHQLLLKALNTDKYGVELDKSTLNITCNINCIDLPYATRHSTNTSCAEEDNVNIPIFHSKVKSFKITATLPEYYPSKTTMNERSPDFANCKFASRNIWEIGVNDSSYSEFSDTCMSETYNVGDPFATFCNEINTTSDNEIRKINFTTKGVKHGLVEASIGSVFTVRFVQVTGNLVIAVRYFGKEKKWLPLGNAIFSSENLTKTWQIPDLTWSEEPSWNQIELEVTGDSSVNASGKFDYLKLDRRNEKGESKPNKVFDNGETVVEVISTDFWWLYPKSMIVKISQKSEEWHNITYFRISRKIPGKNSYPQTFVLYQDGNSRILPFPPDGIDWIPFGSSVIIGPTNSNSVRPYASISRVNIDVLSLKMEIYYESGGKATATLEYTADSTVVNVEDISYTTSPMIPFTTFRSMWVADGNADVDRVEVDSSTWHIQHGWQSIAGLSFKFFRSVVSKHNTLSPDIRIAVECKLNPTSSSQPKTNHTIEPTSSSQPTTNYTSETTSSSQPTTNHAIEPSSSSQSRTQFWAIIVVSVIFTCYVH